MGVAQITCVDGCVCDPVVVDAYDPRPVSVTNIKGLKVRSSNPFAGCRTVSHTVCAVHSGSTEASVCLSVTSTPAARVAPPP